jgi:phospholipid transport system substrate-binding protein
MKAILCTTLLLLVMSQTVTADDSQSVLQLLIKNQDAVLAVVRQADLSDEEKNKKIEEIVTPMFDFPLMAKLTLGKKYWPDLSKEQKDRFTQLFIERMRSSYLGRLTSYKDEKIIYESPVPVDNKIQIPSYLVSESNKISILYKFYQSEIDWRIYDLEIEGVSIIRSYRAQFYQILQNGSFEDLLKKMETKSQN